MLGRPWLPDFLRENSQNVDPRSHGLIGYDGGCLPKNEGDACGISRAEGGGGAECKIGIFSHAFCQGKSLEYGAAWHFSGWESVLHLLARWYAQQMMSLHAITNQTICGTPPLQRSGIDYIARILSHPSPSPSQEDRDSSRDLTSDLRTTSVSGTILKLWQAPPPLPRHPSHRTISKVPAVYAAR